MGNNVVALYAEIETWGYPKADMQQNEQVPLEDHPTSHVPPPPLMVCLNAILWRFVEGESFT